MGIGKFKKPLVGNKTIKEKLELDNDYDKIFSINNKGAIIPSYLKETDKKKTLLNNWKNILDYSDFKCKSRYNPMDNTSGKMIGVVRAIKDGILDGKDVGIDGLVEIHNEIGKKTEDAHNDFFTPAKTAKLLGDKINELNQDNKPVLEIGTGLGSILQHINNGVGIEYNFDYYAIAKHYIGLNVIQKDITKDKMNNKFDFICCNPPFGAEINKSLFNFIKENTTDEMQGILLLPNNYDEYLEKYLFKILEKTPVKEKFTNTAIKTSIFRISK